MSDLVEKAKKDRSATREIKIPKLTKDGFATRDIKNPSVNISDAARISSTANDTVFEASLGVYCEELDQYVLERESLGYQVYPGTEREDYDFTAERMNMYSNNLIQSTAYFVKACLGAGILNMHVAYMYGGIWTSLVTTFVIGFFASHCLMMLVKSAQKMNVRLRIPRLAYRDLAAVAVASGPWKSFRKFSKTFRVIIDISLFLEMCGTCSIYQIMIATTVKQAVETVSPEMKNMNLNERLYVLMITAPILLMCLIVNIKHMAPFSLAADILIVFCVISTMYYSISEIGSINERAEWKSFHGLFRFSGICLFSIDCVGNALAIENNMKKPKYFNIVLEYGTSIVLICVSLTGFLGYWAWGESCKGPITVHMPPDTFPTILQFVMAISLSVSFVVHIWVPFKIAWHYIGKKHKKKRGFWESFYKLGHVSLVTAWSLAFPNMINLMIFIGNFFMASLSIIIPALIESLVTWREPHKTIRWGLIKNCFIMLFGGTLCCAAFYSVLDI